MSAHQAPCVDGSICGEPSHCPPTEPWIKSACMECEFGSYAPEGSEERVWGGRCPNDGSVLLQMDGLIVADDIIEVARLMVKADRAKRVAEREAIAARADFGRVKQLIDRRTSELPLR